MRYSAKRLHMDFLAILTVKTLGEKVGASILLYQTAIRHFYATFLYKPIEGIFQTTEILRFPESGFGGDSVEFYQVIVKAFRSLNLS